MSDNTPRTDEQAFTANGESVVDADFARMLERELNAPKASIGHAMKLEYTEPPKLND